MEAFVGNKILSQKIRGKTDKFENGSKNFGCLRKNFKTGNKLENYEVGEWVEKIIIEEKISSWKIDMKMFHIENY